MSLFVGSHRLFKNPFVDSSASTKLVLRMINTLICIHENENSNINNSDTILGVYIHYKLLIINTINPRIKSVKNIEKSVKDFSNFGQFKNVHFENSQKTFFDEKNYNPCS